MVQAAAREGENTRPFLALPLSFCQRLIPFLAMLQRWGEWRANWCRCTAFHRGFAAAGGAMDSSGGGGAAHRAAADTAIRGKTGRVLWCFGALVLWCSSCVENNAVSSPKQRLPFAFFRGLCRRVAWDGRGRVVCTAFGKQLAGKNRDANDPHNPPCSWLPAIPLSLCFIADSPPRRGGLPGGRGRGRGDEPGAVSPDARGRLARGATPPVPCVPSVFCCLCS